MSTKTPQPSQPYRVLLLTDKLSLAEAMSLALNHGACITRMARTNDEVRNTNE